MTSKGIRSASKGSSEEPVLVSHRTGKITGRWKRILCLFYISLHVGQIVDVPQSDRNPVSPRVGSKPPCLGRLLGFDVVWKVEAAGALWTRCQRVASFERTREQGTVPSPSPALSPTLRVPSQSKHVPQAAGPDRFCIRVGRKLTVAPPKPGEPQTTA